METISLGIGYDYEDKKQLAKYLAGINEELDDKRWLEEEPVIAKTQTDTRKESGKECEEWRSGP